MSKVILTDCDEVLFDWANPFENWVRETYPEYRDVQGKLQDYWHVEAWLGCDIEFTRSLIKTFNSDPQIWPNFKALPGAKEIVQELHSEGWQFVAITACATDAWTHRYRKQNLDEVFGEGVFDTLHCTGLHQSKAGYLSRYRPTYWVEDKLKHATDGADLGHTSFLINYKHNAQGNDPRVIRVNDWGDIYEHIHAREAGPVLNPKR